MQDTGNEHLQKGDHIRPQGLNSRFLLREHHTHPDIRNLEDYKIVRKVLEENGAIFSENQYQQSSQPVDYNKIEANVGTENIPFTRRVISDIEKFRNGVFMDDGHEQDKEARMQWRNDRRKELTELGIRDKKNYLRYFKYILDNNSFRLVKISVIKAELEILAENLEGSDEELIKDLEDLDKSFDIYMPEKESHNGEKKYYDMTTAEKRLAMEKLQADMARLAEVLQNPHYSNGGILEEEETA